MIKVKDIDYNAIYNTKSYGKYKIIDKAGYDNGGNLLLKIKFLTTGYEKIIQYYHLNDNIYDPYYPIVYGVGYRGEPNVPYCEYSKMYSRWSGMLSRCYNTKDINYKTYRGIGVTVDLRWHCFATYFNDIHYLNGYDMVIKNPHIKYYIDKDILQKNIPLSKRVYSPETCMWVCAQDNSLQKQIDHAKNKYHLVSKNHNLYYVKYAINGEIYRVGHFKDEIMAASAANHIMTLNGFKPANDVPYVPQEIVNKNNLKKLDIVIKKINND